MQITWSPRASRHARSQRVAALRVGDEEEGLVGLAHLGDHPREGEVVVEVVADEALHLLARDPGGRGFSSPVRKR
jgi:hypothetical protein